MASRTWALVAKQASPEADDRRRRFWSALLVMLGRLAQQNLFCERFASECCDGHPVGWDADAVARAMIEYFGDAKWPRGADDPPSEQEMLDLVQFFFAHVSMPTDGWNHSFCGSFHPSAYDATKGRYEYTVEVNRLFKRFALPFKLVRGRALRQSSEVLDDRVQEFELPTDDPHLTGLLSKALQHFYDRREDRRWDGLRCMVDAYERLKTAEDPAHKKGSVAKLIGRFPMALRLAGQYDALLAELTRLGNDQTIRHHEHGKAVLADPAVIEFLFYAYFGVVRLMVDSRGGAAPAPSG